MVKRSPLELAALATVAVPGLAPTAVAPDQDDPADFDAAVLYEGPDRRWRVRSPRHEEASTRLEGEYLILKAFTPAIRAHLPFRLPTVAGRVRQEKLSTFVYSHVSGSTRGLEELVDGGNSSARLLGQAIAAIHALPNDVVEDADLPSYTANEFRQRRLNELDQAATSGRIPAALLLRWEHALEDVTLWKFTPCVVHGELHEDNILFDAGEVSAVTGWTDLHVGDPADDFAWLIAAHDGSFVRAVVDAYDAARHTPGSATADPHLLRRAALSAEFALAQFLVRALATEDSEMVAEAEGMLRDLAEDLEAQGLGPDSLEIRVPGGNAPGGNAPGDDGSAADTGATEMRTADVRAAEMQAAETPGGAEAVSVAEARPKVVALGPSDQEAGSHAPEQPFSPTDPTDPKDLDPRSEGPQSADPQNPDSETAESQTAESQTAESQHTLSQDGESQDTMSQDAESQDAVDLSSAKAGETVPDASAAQASAPAPASAESEADAPAPEPAETDPGATEAETTALKIVPASSPEAEQDQSEATPDTELGTGPDSTASGQAPRQS